VGPEHALLRDLERVEYARVSDEAALDAFEVLSSTEGIVPALESAHAIAYSLTLAKRLPKKSWILINLSGRGDKDLSEYERLRPMERL
jgi:tryptophan synthase beta subunit